MTTYYDSQNTTAGMVKLHWGVQGCLYHQSINHGANHPKTLTCLPQPSKDPTCLASLMIQASQARRSLPHPISRRCQVRLSMPANGDLLLLRMTDTRADRHPPGWRWVRIAMPPTNPSALNDHRKRFAHRR